MTRLNRKHYGRQMRDQSDSLSFGCVCRTEFIGKSLSPVKVNTRDRYDYAQYSSVTTVVHNFVCFSFRTDGKTFNLFQCCDTCAGWPLCHGRRGVLTHLVAPSAPGTDEPSSDAYLLLDVARDGLTLNWVGAGARLRSRLSTDTSAMLAGDLQQLSATLRHLVAVVDRSVQRVPLDRIAYPCYACQDRTCQPPQPRHQQQTLAADQVARDNDDDDAADEDNSIPHIDSDPEESTTDRHRSMDNDGKSLTRNSYKTRGLAVTTTG